MSSRDPPFWVSPEQRGGVFLCCEAEISPTTDGLAVCTWCGEENNDPRNLIPCHQVNNPQGELRQPCQPWRGKAGQGTGCPLGETNSPWGGGRTLRALVRWACSVKAAGNSILSAGGQAHRQTRLLNQEKVAEKVGHVTRQPGPYKPGPPVYSGFPSVLLLLTCNTLSTALPAPPLQEPNMVHIKKPVPILFFGFQLGTVFM